MNGAQERRDAYASGTVHRLRRNGTVTTVTVTGSERNKFGTTVTVLTDGGDELQVWSTELH